VVFVLMVLVLLVKPTGLTDGRPDMTAMTDDTIPVTPRAIRDEMIAFAVMTAMLAIVPFTGLYPFFVMQALCFGAAGLRLQSPDRFMADCCRSATRCSWGRAGYVSGHAPESLGPVARAWNPGPAPPLRRACRHHRARRDPPPGHLFRDDYARLVQLLYSSMCRCRSPWRGRHPGHSAGYLFGIFNLANSTILYYVVLAGFLLGFLLIFRTINSPFGEVLKAIRENEPAADLVRLQDRSGTSCLPTSCRERWRGWPAR